VKSSNKSYPRRDRVAGSMRREIARLMQVFQDPRAGHVTVLEVEVTPNLVDACVFVSVMPEAQAGETLQVLNRASGFFRTQLAKAIKLRHMPKIRFAYDDSLLKGQRIDNLLMQVKSHSTVTQLG